MSQETKVVQVTRSKVGHGAALTQVTEAVNHVVIAVPSGKGGILTHVSISLVYALTTVVNAGGVARLRNSSADWDPFYVPTMAATALTEGGDAIKPMVYECSKKLPGNSTVSVDYIPMDNNSQYLEITLHWIMTETDPEMETFFDLVHPLKADDIKATDRTQVTTSWAHNAADVIPIPGHKGGTLKSVILQPWGVMTTVVLGGGLVEMFVDSHDIGPAEWYTTMLTTLGASGANIYHPMVIPHHHEVKANSNYTFFATNRNALWQTVTCGICWERPYAPKP